MCHFFPQTSEIRPLTIRSFKQAASRPQVGLTRPLRTALSSAYVANEGVLDRGVSPRSPFLNSKVMAEVENPMGEEVEMDEDALLADFDAGLKKKKKKKKKPVRLSAHKRYMA